MGKINILKHSGFPTLRGKKLSVDNKDGKICEINTNIDTHTKKHTPTYHQRGT